MVLAIRIAAVSSIFLVARENIILANALNSFLQTIFINIYQKGLFPSCKLEKDRQSSPQIRGCNAKSI